MYIDLVAGHFDRIAAERPDWYRRNDLYHGQVAEVCRPFLNPDSRVLELGCSTGDLLASLAPAYGAGVDISTRSIELARSRFPQYDWFVGDAEQLPDPVSFLGPFDLIILSDLVGYLQDIQSTLESLRSYLAPNGRIIVSLWNWLWQPILRAGEWLGVKAPDLNVRQNWISAGMIRGLLELAGYDVLLETPGLLLPVKLPGITPVVNALSNAPLVERITLLHTLVARPAVVTPPQSLSVSVIIPTRNEVGNIESLVRRVPAMGTSTELVFVDGNSTDGTVEAIQALMAEEAAHPILFIPQVKHDPDTPPNLMLKLGKGDAVRKGFAAATGDVLMILDSDLSVDPEELPKFYRALAHERGALINGTRFTYAQEDGAMKPLNMAGNVFFSLLFSWLLGRRVTDTLCGTKALRREDYADIAANRDYFGDFDPFGDFDLLFGAAHLGLKITDLPVRYRARTYGESKVRVGRHGPLLGQMSLVALWQLKIRPRLDRRKRTSPKTPTFQPRTPVLSVFVALFLALLFVVRVSRRR